MPINGVALGAISIGGIFLYSAIKGKSVLASTQAIITGKSPATVAATNQITTPVVTDATNPGNTVTSGGGSAVADTGTNRSILQNTAAGFGWTGTEWTALVSIEEEEAGFSSTVKNGSSGALGMAQALGHGNGNTGGSLGNEYGGFGLSDAQAKLANNGDAAMQALWMCNYIKATYGDPIKAQAFHLAHNYY